MNQAPPPPPPPPVSLSSIRFGGNEVPKARNHSPNSEFPPPPTSAELQYANLPKQLVTALNKDKKPFTYTPASSIGKKGILDLDQIRSPRMRKRLMLNLKESEEDETNNSSNKNNNNNNQQKQINQEFNNSPRLYELNSAQQQRTMSPLAYAQNNLDTPPPPPPLPNMYSMRNFQQQANNYNRPLSASPTPPLRTNSYGIMASQPAVAQQVLPNLQRPATASPTMNQAQMSPPVTVYGDETRREPIQSRSFLILQRMTQDYMEPLSMNNFDSIPSPEDPRYPIPSRTFRTLQEALGEDRLGTDF